MCHICGGNYNKLIRFKVKICKNCLKLYVKKVRSGSSAANSCKKESGKIMRIRPDLDPDTPLTVLSRLGVDVRIVAHGAELSQRVISAEQEEEEGCAILEMSARSRARKQPVHTTYISSPT
jgi:hypothetical protein